MRPLALLFCSSLALLLSSCAPLQLVGTTKSGRPFIVQSGGTWHKMKGGVLRVQHGDIMAEQILDEPDGVAGPQGLIDAKTTLGLAGLLQEERISADNNKTKVDLKGTKDPNIIPPDPNVIPVNPNLPKP